MDKVVILYTYLPSLQIMLTEKLYVHNALD